jgi:hypothetical protein
VRAAQKQSARLSEQKRTQRAARCAHRRRACSTSDSGGSGVLTAALSLLQSTLDVASSLSSKLGTPRGGLGGWLGGGPGASGSTLAPSAVAMGLARSDGSVTIAAWPRMAQRCDAAPAQCAQLRAGCAQAGR